jgi:hypothetical protein
MSRVRKVSTSADDDVASSALVPPVLSPDLEAVAVRLITRAEAMGLLPVENVATFSVSALDAAMRAYLEIGIGRGIAKPRGATEEFRNALSMLNSVVENSPHPDSEWGAMLRVFGLENLTGLLGISESSLRRYSTNERPTPQPVAVRLHWLALRVADLAGAYNDYGVVRWFDRPRRALGGQSPAQLLTGSWTPDDQRVAEIANLAADLTAMTAS